jgi:circadian clock protein KaiC
VNAIEKLPTGIPGFDYISNGGIPRGRSTLVTGAAGSAKTVFAVQFLAEGVQRGEPGVYVTMEESPEDIRRNMLSFGWEIAKWEREGKWAFVDLSDTIGEHSEVIGRFDLGALIARIEYAVRKIKGVRVSFDSLGALFGSFSEIRMIRAELYRLNRALKAIPVTAILTTEQPLLSEEIGCFGVEEYITDNVVILRNSLEEEKRRRTVEILKIRGTDHEAGEFPFTIVTNRGITVLPLSAIELKQRSSDVRVTSGNKELDQMCGGGFFRDSVILVSGATGTGKTLITTEFLAGGVKAGERCLLFAFEESREQFFRNAKGWGQNFEELEKAGRLKLVCTYPEVMGLEEHLIRMQESIDEFGPNRVAVDSLSALERVATRKNFREFIIGLTSFIKHKEVAGLFTSTAQSLLGGSSVTEGHISTLTDSIILLRYVETYGEMRRGLTVLKMRGSMHDKEIREFTIDHTGMHIGKAFRNVTGILSGSPSHAATGEIERLGGMFGE